MESVHCDRCGAELTIGDYPFCPHGRQALGARVIADDIPGGLWLENYGPKPVKVYSHAERRALMKAQGLEECVRHIGIPGSDRSPHTSRWDCPDPVTLENARILVSRSGARGQNDSDTEYPYQAAIRPFSLEGTGADAAAILEIIHDQSS